MVPGAATDSSLPCVAGSADPVEVDDSLPCFGSVDPVAADDSLPCFGSVDPVAADDSLPCDDWSPVTVDDLLPCDVAPGSLALSRRKPNASEGLWVLDFALFRESYP